MNQQDRTAELQAIVDFHGHICPGLIIGYRAAKLAAKKLGLDRDIDEELVAVVENDACGVDAIQVVLGCSIGKGNLILRDYGKQAFTVFRRKDGQGVRMMFKGRRGDDPDMQKQQRIQEMLAASDEELFDLTEPSFAIPERARIFDSYACESCGEVTMEPRIRLVKGKKVCMQCAQPYHRGW